MAMPPAACKSAVTLVTVVIPQFAFVQLTPQHRRNNRGDRGRLVPPTFRLWKPTMYWSPNFLAVVFKKQEISQQVLLLLSETESFHINYLALHKHFSRYSTSDWFSRWHACCLLGYTRPREPTNELRSHQNAGFSIWVFKNFPGVTPPDPHNGRGRSPPAPTQPSHWLGAGRKRPGVGTLWSPQLFSRGCAPVPQYVHLVPVVAEVGPIGVHCFDKMKRKRVCFVSYLKSSIPFIYIHTQQFNMASWQVFQNKPGPVFSVSTIASQNAP